jgi:hypothetical protein
MFSKRAFRFFGRTVHVIKQHKTLFYLGSIPVMVSIHSEGKSRIIKSALQLDVPKVLSDEGLRTIGPNSFLLKALGEHCLLSFSVACSHLIMQLIFT